MCFHYGNLNFIVGICFCFSYRGAKTWNDLPAETKQATSLNSFKKSIWDFLFFFYTRFCKFCIRFLYYGFYIVILAFYSVIVYCIL